MTEGQVVNLLRLTFDPDRAWGGSLTDAERPAADMPRAQSDPRSVGRLWTLFACAKEGLRRLDPVERARVFFHYGLGWSKDRVAEREGVSVRAVEYSLLSGVRRVTAWINGEETSDEALGLA